MDFNKDTCKSFHFRKQKSNVGNNINKIQT